jgi:hypothetical protein
MTGEIKANELGPDDELRIRAFTDPVSSFQTALYIELRRDGKRYVGEVVFRERPAGSLMISEVPARLFLGERETQSLADSLWDMGARPRGAAGSAGQLDATRAHLDDMRRIAHGFLDGRTRLAEPDRFEVEGETKIRLPRSDE